MKQILLMQNEEALVPYVKDISTITFLEENADLKDYLNIRVNEIVSKNPWLNSYISKEKEKYILVFDPIPQEFNIEIRNLNEFIDLKNIRYSEILKLCKRNMVKNVKVGKKDDQLFKVTLLKFYGNISAFIVSMSHILGDGTTYYSIYKMFSIDTEIKALNPERVYQFTNEDIENSLLGKNATIWRKSVFKQYSGSLLRLLYLKAFRPNKSYLKGGIFSIKDEYIKTIKDKETSIISTNDILTSWYLSKKIEKNSPVMMFVNFRKRNVILTDDLAGNYQGFTIFTYKDDITPSGVRNSLKKKNHDQIFPTYFRSLKYASTFCTNWSSSFHKLKLPNEIDTILHLPLIQDFGFVNECIIFNTGNGPAIFITDAIFSKKTNLVEEDNEFLNEVMKIK